MHPDDKKVQSADDLIGGPDWESRLDRLIEEATELPATEQGSLIEMDGDSAGRRLPAELGWLERYSEPHPHLFGEQWTQAFERARGKVKNRGFVLLHGNRGTGKTQIAAEIARAGEFPPDLILGGALHSGNRDPRYTARYLTAVRFFIDLRDQNRIKGGSEGKIIDRYASCGLLVIDELQERGETAFEDRMLTHLIDQRYGNCRPTILISNHLTRDDFAASLASSVRDRIMENGCRIECFWPSYRTL